MPLQTAAQGQCSVSNLLINTSFKWAKSTNAMVIIAQREKAFLC